MTFMQIYGGHAFDPFNPEVDKINLRDIAHSLSMLCRYTGHCNKFYSVAEHCVLMSRYIDPKYAKEALIHDAPEAYTGDLVSPIKYSIEGWSSIDAVVTSTVHKALLGYRVGFKAEQAIHTADIKMLHLEMSTNMSDYDPDVIGFVYLDDYMDKDIYFWTPEEAEYHYMKRINELNIQELF